MATEIQIKLRDMRRHFNIKQRELELAVTAGVAAFDISAKMNGAAI